MTGGGSEITQRGNGRFDAVGHVAQESARPPASARPGFEGQRQLAALAGGDLPADDPGPVEDAADAQDRHFGVVDDGGRAVHAEDAVVVHGEGAAGQLGRGQPAGPGRLGPGGERGRQFPGGQLVRVVDDRDNQAPVGLGGEAQVDVVGNDDLVLGDPGVQLGGVPQPQQGEPGHQGQQADRRPPRAGVEGPPRLPQSGGVDVDPHGGFRDLAAGTGQLVRGGPAQAAQWNVPFARAGFGGRGDGGALGDGRVDVSPANQARRPGAVDRGQVQPGVVGDLADQRRDQRDPAAVPVDRRCRLNRLNGLWRPAARPAGGALLARRLGGGSVADQHAPARLARGSRLGGGG